MSKTLVYADADIGFAESFSQYMQSEGWLVTVVSDGDAALRTARTMKPTVLVLELNLSGTEGYKVCRLLKFDKRYSTIPIIFYSVGIDDEIRVLVDQVGAQDALEKSTSFEDIATRLMSFVDV